MRNQAGILSGTHISRRCRAGGEAFNYGTQLSMHPDGIKVLGADTIQPVWDDNFGPVRYWKQLFWASKTPAGFAAREAANLHGGLRDQGGTTGVAIAPSDSSRIYTCNSAIIFRIEITDRVAMRGVDGKGTPNGYTLTMSPQTSYKSLANTKAERNNGPYLAVSPADKNRVLWGHNSGLTYSLDGFATNALKRSDVPAVVSGNWMVNVAWAPSGDKAYAHSWGNGLYVCSNPNAAAPSFSPLAGSPLYISRMKVDQSGRVYMVSMASDGIAADGGNNIWTYEPSTGALAQLTGLATRPDAAHDIAIDPSNASRLIVSSLNGVTKQSADRGATWGPPRFPAYGDFFYIASDVPSMNFGQVLGGHPLSLIDFEPGQRNKLWQIAGDGAWWVNFPTPDGKTNWNSQNAGIFGMLGQSFSSHVGFEPVFGNWDRGSWTSIVSVDTSPPNYGVGGFVHLWHQSPLRSAAGSTAYHASSNQAGMLSGWTTDNYATTHAFANQPNGNAGLDGGCISASGSLDRLICIGGYRQPLRFTLDRAASPWQLLNLPGLPAGCAGGMQEPYYAHQSVCPDPVAPDEHLCYHGGIAGDGSIGNSANAGFFRIQLSSTGPTVTRLTTGFAPGGDASMFQMKLEGIPGRADEFIFAGGPLLRVKRSGNKLDIQPISKISGCISFDYGAPASTAVSGGSAEWTLVVLGKLVRSGVYGIHYTTQYPDGTETWTTISAIPVDDFSGWPSQIFADRSKFLRFFGSTQGKGWSVMEKVDAKVLV